MESKIRVAIDGPSGAGKSTIAKEVAKKMRLDYIDTGAMYRAVAYKFLQEAIDLKDEVSLKNLLEKTEIDFSKGDIILDGQVVNDKIRTPEVTKMASECSALKAVREKLVDLQRKMGQTKSVIMDGRDIGTNVLKDAEYKIFMTAAAKERAYRRWLELTEKGATIPLQQVEEEMIERDYNDSTRALNPLKMAEDAIELDTTGMTIPEVIEKITEMISEEK